MWKIFLTTEQELLNHCCCQIGEVPEREFGVHSMYTGNFREDWVNVDDNYNPLTTQGM